MHMHLTRFFVALSFWGFAVATPALAQDVAGGLFGATRADAGRRDKLTVQMSMSEGLESEVPLELRNLVQQDELQSGGRFTVLAASADYARNRRRVQLFGNASTYFRYVPGLDRIAAGSQSAHLGTGLRLPKQGNLEISQTAAYSPSYLYRLFPTATPLAPGESIPVNPDYRIDETESYSYRTRLALAFGSRRGTRLTTTANYSLTDFKKQTAFRPNVSTSATGARVSRALSRNAALSAGYEYVVGEFGRGGRTKEHRATMGVEYSTALSVSRRATFRLDVTPSIFEIPESTLTAVERREYPLQAEVSVHYPFRLKWGAFASYRRSVDYMPGLVQPVFANGARVSLAGVIGRRVDVSALAGYATASPTNARSTRPLSTYTGEARIRYALTRTFAIYSEYLYYHYDLGEHAQLTDGLPSVYNQRGIRVGFTLFGQPISR
jgi:hypothetical protein